MISVEQAREFANDHFPKAPEELVKRLGISVRESAMQGCDGFCLTLGDRSIIRLNSQLSPGRKRFTLAHELGHLVLGVPGVIGETFEDMMSSDSAEERQVNDLASALLLPEKVVTTTLPDLPVVATGLQRLAKKANISDVAAAIRVCNLAGEIGLINASVVFFDNDHVKWQWSRTLTMPEDTAISLRDAARQESPNAFRHQRDDGNVIVASIIDNPYFGSATLFVQLLPEEHGLALSHHERRKAMELALFADDQKLQPRVSGLMGAHKPRVSGKTLNEAVSDFWKRNTMKLTGTAMDSQTGREYVELRISEWI